MNFKYLNTIECPECGAAAVSEGFETDFKGGVRVHCNGQRWEWRKFACGARVVWVPNFEHTDMDLECSKSPDVLKREAHRKALIDKVMTVLGEDISLSKADLSSMEQSVKYMIYNHVFK